MARAIRRYAALVAAHPGHIMRLEQLIERLEQPSGLVLLAGSVDDETHLALRHLLRSMRKSLPELTFRRVEQNQVVPRLRRHILIGNVDAQTITDLVLLCEAPN